MRVLAEIKSAVPGGELQILAILQRGTDQVELARMDERGRRVASLIVDTRELEDFEAALGFARAELEARPTAGIYLDDVPPRKPAKRTRRRRG